ncbi:glycosyltransferase family 2 protein [Kaistella sp. DKR-2]|uniref:glycosyltransferase family 2 protein n=1 Tax=Kaistella soli TaxID=2849654 RepID=UPI001C2624FD|nr:glycosyltransferase family 2 protein [Kaistella soli]MBU8882746.1 glycosyltransferase family 2 protein [Kaistella soli]
MERIGVLLATYNGEKFIAEQLQSLIDQTYSNWILYVRDDCSSDGTLTIIKDFEKKFPEKLVILQNEGRNLGAKDSFAALLNFVEEEYYMFCDQDDVWVSTKIERSLAELKRVEHAYPGSPVLCFCDAIVADEELNVIEASFWKSTSVDPFYIKQGKRFEIFNCAPGCTMIINHKLKKHLFPFPDKAPMHDWWISIVAQRVGIVHPINEGLILYRQHSSNTIGAESVEPQYFLKKLFRLSNLFKTQQNHLEFLREINGMGKMEFYISKLRYTLIRFMTNR